jgi:DNA repair exonuclease SbcCD ATPase subunit
LNSVHITPENERNSKIDLLENRSKNLEEKITEYVESNNKRVNLLRDQIGKIQRMLEEEKDHREQVLQAKYRDMANLETKFTQLIEGEINTRKESDSRLIRLVDERFNSLRTELVRESKLRAENIDLVNNTLEADLPKLNEAIRVEGNEREEVDTAMMKRYTEELNKLNETIQNERKNREESETAIYDMLKDVVSKVKAEIDTEKKERETTEETLLGLLEETCNKLNVASHI